MLQTYSIFRTKWALWKPGKWADIIAVQRDPLKDVSVLMEVDFVMKGGKVMKRLGHPRFGVFRY